MSDSNRLLNAATGVAIFLLLAFCLAMAALEYAYDDSGNPGAHGAYSAEHLKEAASAGLFEIQAATPDNRSASEQYHERQDLAAQRGMAYIAALQLLVSALGLFFLVRTLHYTAEATKAAADAAEAASKSLALTERDLSERERPRLFASFEEELLYAPDLNPSAHFRLKNVGERAAIAFKAWTKLRCGPIRERPKPDESWAGVERYPTIMEDTLLVANGGDTPIMAWKKSPFTQDELDGINAETHAIYVSAVVFYRDHLNETRIFGFCQVFIKGKLRRLGREEGGYTFLEYTYDRKEKDSSVNHERHP